MINSVNSSSLVNRTSFDSAVNPLSAEEMFKKLSRETDPKASTIGAQQESYTDETTKSDENGNVAHVFTQNNFKPGTNALNSDSEEDEEVYLFKDEEEEDVNGLTYDGKSSLVSISFDALAAKLGTNDKITKEQLFAYLQNLVSSNSEGKTNTTEVAFVKNLITKFDTLSNGEDYITSFNSVDVSSEFLFNAPAPEVVSTVEYTA
jgi:hypothetical protein